MPPQPEEIRKRSAADYVFGKLIGEGSFSSVYLAKDIHNSKEYAIKVCEKRHILREKKREYVLREKEVFRIIGSSSPYFVHLSQTFQDEERLYFVLTYARNGELLTQITKYGCFNMECTKYYTAELILALEFLHSKGIIHRDLKPENILLDDNWHLRITDFGSAKILSQEDKVQDSVNTNRRRSFVGTAQFVSPEVLSNNPTTYASDLWALGCIIYQMVAGEMPFRGPTEYLIFKNILSLKYEFPNAFNETAKDLVNKLLIVEPSERLGANDENRYQSIRAHSLFSDVNWDNLGPPPTISDDNESAEHIIPDNLEPGLDAGKVSKLHLDVLESQPVVRKKSESGSKLADLTPEIISQRLEAQKDNIYNEFVDGNLIIKQGLVDKKKGLFLRRRMFLLTLGPHLYYVDPLTMTLKGEIPWSQDMSTEAKNFKIFYVHTPNRRYNLEDPEGYALEWCKAIDEMKAYYFPQNPQ
ncbi:3-phosphoinositide-dependent protein kinase 1 [Aethina tumida]|uniref:3-phosphoinositide-dependent protein kinase 1 n=1 Tax=Aethina tumida TaxID=116153 RepID=UPI0021479635|nr:3-phosphoinositide-dependent protein kinase 1 [Aethina tumida]